MGNFKNPQILVVPNPQGLDAAIALVQNSMASLTWLQKIFGRAKIQPRKDVNGKKNYEPMVYQGGKDYYPVLPNDALQSYSFFRVVGSRNFQDVGNYQFTTWEQSTIEIIFWVNLKAIDSTKDYLFTDELIEDVKSLLSKEPKLNIISVVDEDIREIYKGYTVKDEHRDLIMYPYQAFKFTCTLSYESTCTP